MAEPGPRIVSINELRFRPANSNDSARAGMEHAFKDVPDCCFGKDDGISPYMAADAGIGTYPDNPASQPTLDGDVPDVAQVDGSPALTLGEKLLRGGFGLSIFLHVVVFCAVGYYATNKLPDDAALLEGETVIAVEFFSETDSDVTTRKQQLEEEGEDEAVEPPTVEPKVEPKQEVVQPVKPVEVKKPVMQEKPVVEKPVEQAKLPEPVEKPVETPKKIEQPVIVTDEPEVLSTTEPSSFQIEAAAKQIIEDTKIEPLPDSAPPMLVTPVEEQKIEPAMAVVKSLPHAVSKPRVVQKVAEVTPVEVKPVEKPVEKPVVKQEEPNKEQAKKPEPTPKKEVKKKTVARDGNSDVDSNKGNSTAKKKDGVSQDASQGNSRNKLKGNAAFTNYKGMVERKLARSKKRVTAGAKGDATVAFTIDVNGNVLNLHIRKSSGKPAVDKAALDVVRKASPFPAIPPDTGKKSYPVSMRVTINK